MFGTTTDRDLKPIHKQVNRIVRGLVQVAHGLEVEDKRLAGFMSLQTHRIDNLVRPSCDHTSKTAKINLIRLW